MITKHCINCGIKFKVNSNRQKYCMNCKYITQKNRQKIYNKTHYQKNKVVLLKRCRDYQKINKDKLKEYKKKYFQLNKDKQYNYRSKKRKIDINYKLAQYLRNRLGKALKGLNKHKHANELLGCNINFLKQYLESQFKKGMNWNNYGKWHIDHIKPCCSFDLSKAKEQSNCFNYKNLQPLWAKENLSKSGRFAKT